MAERSSDASLYLGNLAGEVDADILYELMLQAAPVVSVRLPRDRVTQHHQGYGFVQFPSAKEADYASKLMNGVRLFGRPLRVSRAAASERGSKDFGAQLFIGNLDTLVDEKFLEDTFGTFGKLASAPRVSRDENGRSKGHGFIVFTEFDSADKALASMNGQYLMNKPCTLSYARKDNRGHTHGDEAERLLASHAAKNNYSFAPATGAKPRNDRQKKRQHNGT